MNYQKIPKIELHRHLEGSVRLSTIAAEARAQGIRDLPFQDLGALRDKCQVLQPMRSLQEVLDVFWNTQKILGTPEAITRVTYELLEDAWNDGIRILEIRYSPEFLTHNHELSFTDALLAIEAGIAKARSRFDIQTGLIGIASRNFKIESAQATLDHMRQFPNSFIGFDFADDESDVDFTQFAQITADARKAGFGITIHSGEEIGSESFVLPTIEVLGATRIGHGLQIFRDPEILRSVSTKNVILELCPTSNFLTNAVPALRAHPARKLLESGVQICINTDDPGVMGTDLSTEYRICMEQLGFSKDQLQQTLSYALLHSFLDADRKKYVHKKYFDFIRLR